MKELLDFADKDHEAHKISIAKHAKWVREKEISLYHVGLRKAFFVYVKKLTHTSVATVNNVNKHLKEDMKLSLDESTHKTAYDLLSWFNDDSSNLLGFKCSELVKDSAEIMEDSKEEENASTQLADTYTKEYILWLTRPKEESGRRRWHLWMSRHRKNVKSHISHNRWSLEEDQKPRTAEKSWSCHQIDSRTSHHISCDKTSTVCNGGAWRCQSIKEPTWSQW